MRTDGTNSAVEGGTDVSAFGVFGFLKSPSSLRPPFVRPPVVNVTTPRTHRAEPSEFCQDRRRATRILLWNLVLSRYSPWRVARVWLPKQSQLHLALAYIRAVGIGTSYLPSLERPRACIWRFCNIEFVCVRTCGHASRSIAFKNE